MRLITLLVLTTLVLLQHGASGEMWPLPAIVHAVFNKTAQLSNYVREKSKTLRTFYKNNLRHKLTAYFQKINDVNKIDEKEEEKEVTHEIKWSGRRREVQAIEMTTTSTTTTPPTVERNTVLSLSDRVTPAIDADVTPRTTKVHKKCLDEDPTTQMSTPQLIAVQGYPAESHTIITEDDYILTVHRIPYSRSSNTKSAPRKTVLLHHGLLGSSADWVLSGPSKALAFILSEAGYDVWLANVRGNTYSRAHKKWNTDNHAFWNFTFHEVSQYDLPAVIDYIMNVKGWDTKINYVGHSMGTTILFALLSTKTHYNKVLRAGFALAPVAYMSKIKSPIRLLAKFSSNIDYLLSILGADEFLPQSKVMKWLSKHACELNHYEEVVCENSMFMLCGFDDKQFDKTLLPKILGHTPAGASTKTLIHYAQEINNNGRFQQFDFGPEINMKVYDSFEPPPYPIQKITLPIALISAENDWLSSDVDATNLYVQLVNPIEHFIVPFKEFNHIDFLWGIDAPKLVYLKLLQLMEEGDHTAYKPKFEKVLRTVNYIF